MKSITKYINEGRTNYFSVGMYKSHECKYKSVDDAIKEMNRLLKENNEESNKYKPSKPWGLHYFDHVEKTDEVIEDLNEKLLRKNGRNKEHFRDNPEKLVFACDDKGAAYVFWQYRDITLRDIREGWEKISEILKVPGGPYSNSRDITYKEKAEVLKGYKGIVCNAYR